MRRPTNPACRRREWNEPTPGDRTRRGQLAIIGCHPDGEATESTSSSADTTSACVIDHHSGSKTPTIRFPRRDALSANHRHALARWWTGGDGPCQMGCCHNAVIGTGSRLRSGALLAPFQTYPTSGARFLNDVVTGVSGKQIPLKDPPTTHRVVRADLPEATTLRSSSRTRRL